jgi:pimeloyl-ACP methyl ester carboxylesterase
MSAEDKVAVKDISFKCSDGIELAAQRWTKSTVDSSTKRLRILCLHGFLDNCRSFYYLAPFLVSSLEDSELVALDFPGHGLSQHATIDNPPIVINDLCYYTAEAIRILNWENYGFMLLGHSMGSVVSLIYAATFPDQVRRLVLIDG